MSIYTDYGSSYDTGFATSGVGTILGGFMLFFVVAMIVAIAISVIMIIAQWKIFKKAGRPGWHSIIPFLNTWTLFEMAGLQGWLSLIPVVNIFALWVVYYKLAIKFGKSSGFAICTLLFPMVCLPILAFDKSIYGESNISVNNGNINQNYQYNTPVESNQQFSQPTPISPVQPIENSIQPQSNIINQPQVPVVEESNLEATQILSTPIMTNNNNEQNIVTNNNPQEVSATPTMTQPAKVCPTCHKSNVSTAMFCEDCGTKL